MIAIPESYALLTCGQCGHSADFFDFCRAPITGDLPKGSHQCPACRKAWKMEIAAPGRMTASGLFIPPTRKASPIPSFL